MQMEDILCVMDLHLVLGERKSEDMHEDDWKVVNRKALGLICFSLSSMVASIFLEETSSLL